MVRFWLVCFVLLFTIVELWQWLQHLTLSIPLCVMGGFLLSIVSNLNFSSHSSHSSLPSLPPTASKEK